jgi:hypothetical protein
MITQKKVIDLFEKLWPRMHGAETHKETCLKHYHKIEGLFIKHNLDFDSLLNDLVKYDGIKVTIASGLIWASYPGRAVPFDKYTTAWSLKKGYIKSPQVSSNYKAICNNIIKAIKARRKPINVEEFVREAIENVENLGWPDVHPV